MAYSLFLFITMEVKQYRHIAIVGSAVYVLALALVSLLFRQQALQPLWVLWGLGEVLFFFGFSWLFYLRCNHLDTKRFLYLVFFTALGIRVVYAVAMCYYFYFQTGFPFEYDAGDSLSYHKTSVFLAQCVREGHVLYVFQYLHATTMGFSDQGYSLWLTLIYTVFGRNVLTPRIFKSLMSAYMCIALYRLGSRTFDEKAGRVAAVLCVFMPTLIQISGLHTKECEMIFLAVLALERMDYVIRSRRYSFWNIAFPVFLTALTFGFRTIIGIALIFSFVIFVILSDGLVAKRTRIVALSAVMAVFLVFLFSPIGNEMNIIYRFKFSDKGYLTEKYQSLNMQHAELAKSVYMAPGAFVLPLSSMVEAANDNQKMMNGSMYVKNVLAYFAMLALVLAFRDRKWRNFSLIGAFELAYLFMIMFSFAANSERYHQPAIPLLLLMASYALTNVKRKGMYGYYAYCVLLLVALIGWNWIKLSARNLC